MLIQRSHSIWTLLAATAFGLAARQGAAAQLTVCSAGCTHSTIQATVDVAADGDTILIHPGRYVETVTIQGKSLTLLSSIVTGQGSSTVNVVGPGRGPVFVLGSGTDTAYKQVTIGYLSISGGTHPGGTGVGGGIQVRKGAYLNLFSSTVSGNTAQSGGGVGIDTPNGPDSVIDNCVISGNSASAGGGIVVKMFSTLNIRDKTVIAQNSATLGGGGFTESFSNLTVDNTVISGNLATGGCNSSGGGTSCNDGLGGGLLVGGGFALTDSTVTLNEVDSPGDAGGAGLYLVLESSPLTITRSVISHNTVFGDLSGNGGGIYAASVNPAYVLQIAYSYVVDNNNASNPGSASGGIFNQGTLSLDHTLIANNTPGNCMGGTGCP
ncbi:MAG TPA: hypothetical protein VNO35_08605 [Steroidobacteraceae bacterium]|nr:hypothetical protein [Steroidobacteraceae bacterium]